MATYLIISVVIIGSDSFHHLSQGLCLWPNLCLSMTQIPHLPASDATRDLHLWSQGRKTTSSIESIMYHCPQLSIPISYQDSDSIEPTQKAGVLLSGMFVPLASSFLLSSGWQWPALLLVCIMGWLKQLGGCLAYLAVQGLGELLNLRRHQSAFRHCSQMWCSPLAQIKREVSWGDVLSSAKVLRLCLTHYLLPPAAAVSF